MSKFWLKVIGDSKRPRERYEEPFIGFPKRRRPRNIHVGDHMILYAVGGSKRVFAHVEVTSEPYERSEWPRWPHSVNVRYLLNLPVTDGVHIDHISTPERNLLNAIKAGGSYFELTPEEYKRAAALLGAAPASIS